MKKVLALVLAVVLAFGMATTAFATSIPAGDGSTVALGVTGGVGDWEWMEGFDNNDKVEGDISDDLSVNAEGEVFISVAYLLEQEGIMTDLDEASQSASTISGLTESRLNSMKIDVKRSISKGSAAIRDIDFWTGTRAGLGKDVYVRVRFIKEHVSTKDLDFDFTVYLTQKGSRLKNTNVTFAGTLANPEEEVSEDDDYVGTADKIQVKALDYIRDIEVDGGNGVSLKTKMFEDKKYYFTVNLEVNDADDTVLTKYPEIEAIYNLNMVGFSTAGNIVQFDISDKYYVYNAEGKYIGTTTEMLPFSKKMYVSTKRIDMDLGDGASSEEPTTSEAPTDGETPSNPPMGGDNGAPNVNDNPGTGANGFVNVAVALGMVSLAAAAVSKKK